MAARVSSSSRVLGDSHQRLPDKEDQRSHSNKKKQKDGACGDRYVLRIKIPNFPLELYDDRILWRIGESIRTMLRIDSST
ncbi:hypothetical protein RJT34_04126 [Clitoria ternatea]|uniref:Uncharacterized protein n=1 Tax=Clitoria ternatea TaxID=43366 RepID=A0AAN9KKB7_CLITE